MIGALGFLISGDGEVISGPKKVASTLIEVLKDIQLSDKFTQYTGNLPFPDLPPLDEEEAASLLSKLSTGKAISFDLFSDVTSRSICCNQAFQSLKEGIPENFYPKCQGK